MLKPSPTRHPPLCNSQASFIPSVLFQVHPLLGINLIFVISRSVSHRLRYSITRFLVGSTAWGGYGTSRRRSPAPGGSYSPRQGWELLASPQFHFALCFVFAADNVNFSCLLHPPHRSAPLSWRTLSPLEQSA